MSQSKRYKYCIVPQCKNTSVKSPDKLFVCLPSDIELRTLWQKSMRRTNFVSNKGSKYCCEDHFDLEEDLENYMYIKTMKTGTVKLKPGVVPHIFKCQKEQLGDGSRKSGEPYLKRKKKELVSSLISSKGTNASEPDSSPDDVFKPIVALLHNNQSVQVNLKPLRRSKGIQCNFPGRKIILEKVKRKCPCE